MKIDARRSPLLYLIAAAVRQVLRRPYLSASVVAHVALLALLYYYGTYQPELRQQAAEVASSLRATSLASTAKRLQDLQTIKRLLEKSADRADTPAEPSPDPAASPQTPEQMVERAREVSQAIDRLDKEFDAEELARLTGVREPPPAADHAPADEEAKPEPNAKTEATDKSAQEPPTQTLEAKAKQAAGKADGDAQADITPEEAASEVATLEAKARTTLAKRQQHLDAKANGVEVEGSGSGSGAGTGSGSSSQGSGGRGSVRGEIAEFMGASESTEETSGSTGYASQDFFADGDSRIPPVDATTLVLGGGRMLGAGGEYTNRLYLNSWYLIGPFPGRHGAGLFENPSYPPEKAVLLDAVYFGKDQRLLKWRYVTDQSYPLYPPDMAEDSVYYGYTEVFVDRACDLTAWIGVDDDVQVYLNDQLVWKGGNVNKRPYFDAIFSGNNTYLQDYNRTEGKRLLHFNQGRNKIFFKMSNGPNKAFLSMVLTR